MQEIEPIPNKNDESVSTPASEAEPIEEIDLTNLDLPALQEALTGHIQRGSFLHGRRSGSLTELPMVKSRNDSTGDEFTAVFATDHPLIALARGSAGSRLTAWEKQILFRLENPQLPLDQHGYVYLVPAKHFSQNDRDFTEYLSRGSVHPTARIKFATATVAGIFRSPEEFETATDPITDQIRPEAVRPIDITTMCLVLRNALTLIGPLENAIGRDYGVENPYTFERFIRLANIVGALEPVLSQISHLSTEEQKELIKSVRELWKITTYEKFNLPELPFVEATYDYVNPLLENMGK